MRNATADGSSCTSGVFFDDHRGNTGQLPGDAGLCRYNPPISQPDPDARGFWPVVAAEDWCGHHTAQRDKVGAVAAE